MEKGYSINIKNLEGDVKLNSKSDNSKKFTPNLSKLIKEFKEKEILDGDMIENLFFPTQEIYDIFISHSHTDKEIAKNFAAYLTNEGYKVFLDSKIWGSADELLKLIDDRYSKNINDDYYSYEKRNFSTSHIHSLLNSALSKAVENSRVSVFITGENSINNSGNELETKVKSPWIYQELNIYNLIMRQKPGFGLEVKKTALIENCLQIERDADMSNLEICSSLNALLSELDRIKPTK
ncbi:toll/interleukin-1 receptor domain-containing protein [Psychrilyobacter atlanticus]|uniref:toll/interleukin-1 receptor domain-containing protein n=1 Tax=Psychrilyobacter atlanticus TaxID=271091 RepID=UPI0003F958DD|nr:toll/interleukin-1 receptor domain-containing protein [Psychrilyobacter atlanticus]